MPGLNNTQALALVRQGLGFRADLETNISAMFDLLQFDELERGVELPWFLILEDQPLSGTANDPTLTLPSNFIRMVDDGGVYITTSGGLRRYLRKRPIDWVITNQQDSIDGTLPSGDPMYYAIRASSLYVNPIPTAAWTGYVTYYAHDALYSSLAVGGQNLWLTHAPGLLVNLVGARMAQDIKEPDAEAKFQKRFASAQLRLDSEIALRETSDNEFSMGNQA